VREKPIETEASAEPGTTRNAARLRLLEAAEACLLRDGYAALSTRSVAELAGTPLSQIHYHFGSRQGLVLALLEHQNTKLLKRQAVTLTQDRPLSEVWLQTCDHLEEDIESGYVRVLQEIIAAGYSDEKLAAAAREVLNGWYVLLAGFAGQADPALLGWGALESHDLGVLIGLLFMGAESMTLVGWDRAEVYGALRGVGRAMAALEARRAEEGATHAG
jgi:AcrR family transcriptional regulator